MLRKFSLTFFSQFKGKFLEDILLAVKQIYTVPKVITIHGNNIIITGFLAIRIYF